MPILTPYVRLVIAVLTTAAIGISQGALNLSGAIPADWIKPVTAWCGIIAFLSSAVTSVAVAAGATTANRIASAASLEGVKRIDVTPETAAVVTSEARNNTQIVTIPQEH